MALLATASLLLISQIIIQLTIINMKDDARVVNISGRQRMLSQKITKCSLGILLADTGENRTAFIVELSKAKELWQQSHEALRYGSKEMHLPGDNSAEVNALYEKMEPHYQAIISSVDYILNIAELGQGQSALLDYVLKIRANETEFLKYMDNIVFQYDHESNTKLFHLQVLECTILGIALLVLAFEWRIVFKPAQREIKAGFDVMKKMRNTLTSCLKPCPR